MKYQKVLSIIARIIVTIGMLAYLFHIGREFSSGAADIEHLTPRWIISLSGFWIFILVLMGLVVSLLWFPHRLEPVLDICRSLRQRAGKWMYLLALSVVLFPAWLYQYSRWGEFLTSGWLRFFVYFIVAIIASAFITRHKEQLISREGFLGGVLLASSSYMFATAFVGVTSYPLSLTWSEGNRLWDYSLLFGRDIYHYPPQKAIPAGIDFGRQLLWGLPFLIPGVDIRTVRLWSALVSTVPYAILGWCAFRRPRSSIWWVFFLGLWSFIFLKQAAIYTPLVVSAILVVISWREKWYVGVPLLGLAGCYAYLTRTTWALAPAIWAFTLIFVSNESDGLLKSRPWGKAILYGLSALGGAMLTFGWRVWQESSAENETMAHDYGMLAIFLIVALILAGLVFWQRARLTALWQVKPIRMILLGAAILSIMGAGLAYAMRNLAAVRDQPLLWERLWPTTTNPQGILIALGIAVLPTLILLVWLAASRRWLIDRWQAPIIVLPLLAFLGVGIIASVKSGGGSNLHNLDMFLVGLVITAALAWQGGGQKVFSRLAAQPVWVYLVLICMLVLPAMESIMNIAPLDVHGDEKIYNVITRVRDEVKKAAPKGEVLFIDQRQLLTFGLVKNVALVPEYEKKILMDEAMAGDQVYFDRFYTDLESHRFALIVSEPLKVTFTVDKESDYGFGQENDMWVKWVAEPVLRYYEPLETYTKGRRVQLLVPRFTPLP